MGTKGRPTRGELAWIALAISSLPVPLSPWIKTVERLGETWPTRSKTRCMPSLLPMMFEKLKRALRTFFR